MLSVQVQDMSKTTLPAAAQQQQRSSSSAAAAAAAAVIPVDAGRCPAWQESSRAIGQGDAQPHENLVSQLRQGGIVRPGGQSTGSDILFT